MIKTTGMLRDELAGYGNPDTKIARMVSAGELISLKRGVYETNLATPGAALAGVLYGPSYLSFEYALSFHGLIPERVGVYTSATFQKNRTKRFQNVYGVYSYQDIPAKAFPYGVALIEENGYTWSIASPEKALCDQLYCQKSVSSMHELEGILFAGFRIDEGAFIQLDFPKLAFLASLYRKKNLGILCEYIDSLGEETALQ